MCRKWYIDFWTPTTTQTAQHEANVRNGRINQADHNLTSISRIHYYECKLNPHQSQYFRDPVCPNTITNTEGIRQGNIRAFCGSDDGCEVRIHNCRKDYDEAVAQLNQARADALFAPDRGRVVSWERQVRSMFENWKAIYQEHFHCPDQRCRDPLICALVQSGAIDRPLELFPDRRLGYNPWSVQPPR